MARPAALCCLLLLSHSRALLDDRPRIRTDGGHLFLEGAPGKNISFNTRGAGGAVAVNGLDVAKTFSLLNTVRPQLQMLQDTSLNSLLQNLSSVAREVASETNLAQSLRTLRGNISDHMRRLEALQTSVTRLDVVATRVDEVTRVLGPDGNARLANISATLNAVIDQIQSHDLNSQASAVTQLRSRMRRVEGQLNDLSGVEGRLEALESSRTANSTGGFRRRNFSSRDSRRLRTLQRTVSTMRSILRRRECNSLPCKRGGTCIDAYNGFQCLCPPGWTGTTCNTDVDECMEYSGTDLGCQNGGTCTNTDGGYRCTCPGGWYGRHCTLREDTCNTGSASTLCDHGDCYSQASEGRSYTCRCHQGWTKAPGSHMCSQDVDECAAGLTNHCSANPVTQCINLPGSYMCGPCPAGYTGDGFRCTDINECELFNGGCSLSPRVECINEVGGRRCGSCPPGYTGDGVSCSPSPRPCLSNPCHHLATCSDSFGNMLPGFYQCTCPPGYAGNGVGPFGCSPVAGGGGANACSSNPCVHGTCTPNGNSFLCHCLPGYAGVRCETSSDPCSSSPCQNGGTCNRGSAGTLSFTCVCPTAYTGPTCSQHSQRCGGILSGTGGIVHYPSPGVEHYNHNISCAWVISVQSAKIINVTFSEFHLEADRNCRYDWLQIHDGGRSTAPLIGRFCGTNTPGTNNTLLSTHNRLYLWFRSDHSRTGTGFTFNWTAQDPECGGIIRGQQHGSFSSPGYPGNYPNNRNCSWSIITDPGKRLLFHFATLAIETHPNCSFDRLEIRDGLQPTSPLLQQYCTSGSPAPLRTSGAEASIMFVTDASETDTGFHISFSSEPSYPGCGGLITADEGSFSAPTLAGRYRHNLVCEWVIRVPVSEAIQLNITDFHLERGWSRCTFDFIEIRDGGTSDSPLMGRYCGRQAPPPFTSSSNELYIKFKSDSSIAMAGFTATHRVVCGGEFLDPTGVIRSPYFPNPYPHNRECVYVIRQPVGKAVVLNFTSFDVEASLFSSRCYYDYVEIRDGSSGSFPLLGHYCGPPSATPPLTTSTLNFMWIKFRTDSSIANRGFEASYWTIDIHCGGILKGTSGTVSSPSGPTYSYNNNCNWVIEAPPGHVVQITWLTFALPSRENCVRDYVEIFDNSSIAMSNALNRESTPLRYCGSTPPPVMTSQGAIVTVHFRYSYIASDGFSFIYHAFNASSVCGGHYHTEVGTFASPRYPNAYPSSRTCVWTITAPPNRQVALNFETFDVGRSPICHDYVEIRNGGLATSPLIAKICGRNITVPEILSHSHQLFVKMVSNRWFSGRGFQARWDGASTGCGGTMTAVTGEIISPGYPQPYHHRADCYWDIRVSRGSQVMLHITDLEMETAPLCRYDYIEISDPLVPMSTRRLCSAQGIVTFNATSNRLKLRFRSDHSVNSRGFRARYFSNCRNDLTGPHGVIESPNFPDAYPHDRNCSWTIRAPLGNSIRLAFSHFEVEDPLSPASQTCHWDYVEVRVGSRNDSSRTPAGHHCGSRLPRPIESAPGLDVMQVIFISDASVALNGFRAEWQIVGCGGMYTKSSGNFTSPNYPGAYPANRNCEWHIRTDPGTRIKITIHGFDIEAPTRTNDCIFDALTVRGGPDETAPVLTQLCHANADEVSVTTDGNTALLVLNSDGSVRGNGFQASYVSLPGGCGGEFTAPHGLIQSPSYPSNYDRHADCVWTITVDALHVVKLSFMDFAVEPHSNCSYDYLSVYDGANISAPLLLQHCGSSLPSPPVWRSTGPSLTLRLKTDGSSQSRGFQANYSTACGARISLSPSTVGQLKSPNYPNVFQAGVNCTWHLEASPGERIQLVFNHLDIIVPSFAWNNGSCISDFISVHDGAEISSPEIGRFCGSSSPPTVYSSSRYLTVRMIIRMATGVGFKATYSEVSNGCGGDLTSANGQFASPYYPDSYPNGYDCTWTITAGEGNRVQLRFPQFELVDNENCNTDYVEVHERDATGPLLAHNCSNAPPSVITAQNALWVRFRSGDNGTAAGFLASYSLLFNNELRSDSGVIVSPLYPHTYHGNDQYTWHVWVSGSYVSVTIEEMSIELDPTTDECLSSITIYNGFARLMSQAIGTFCGHMPPDSPIVASGSQIFIVFNSRSRFEGSRFRLRYNSLDFNNGTTIADAQEDHVDPNCKFSLRVDNYVRFTSPNYPSNYNNSLSCEWVLQAAPHNRLRLFLVYELEEDAACTFDYIDVYNGVNGVDNWNHTHRLCRRDQRRIRIPPSDGRFMKVRFVSDYSVTARGFVAVARSVCGGVLQEPDGFITSPKFGRSNYPNRQDCVWKISVRPGRTIRLEFDVMRIANMTPNCMDDFLLIRNGGSPSSPFLGQGRYCGRVYPPPLVSASNVVTLQFKSDSRNNGRGFRLRYYEVSAACGGSHRLSSDITNVIISTPSYPHPPHPHTECSWVITAPHDQTINMTFIDQFDIASYDGTCTQAWVELRDGGTILAPSLGKFCGTRNPHSVLSTGAVLFVQYYNNITEPHSGFKANASIGTCGGSVMFYSSGVLTSPGYPSAYEENINCSWILTAPLGHYITFHYLQLNIHSTSSNCSAQRGLLEIRELNATGDVLDRVCGNRLPDPIETGSNVAVVNFFAGTNPLSATGFSLMYNVSLDECGGEFTGRGGSFSSPGYPHGYSHRRRCEWRIQAPAGKRVRIVFTDVQLARSRGRYCRDYLLVYNGLDKHAPLLHNPGMLCNANPGVSLNSSMAGLRVVFRTRGHSNSRGFSATWSADDDQECGGELTGTSGSLASPGLSSGYYNHSLNCLWTYRNPSNTSLVLSIGHLHLERRCYDFILIEGIAQEEQQFVQRICNENTDTILVLPYPTVRISFITDYSVNFTGWNMTYTQAACGGYLRGPNSILTSPGYPSAYPNNAHCAWFLQYQEGSQIDFQFTDFNLEDSIHHDYVRILNGPHSTSPELGWYSGGSNPGNVGPSMTNSLMVYFMTDASTTARGFRALANQHDAGCGGVLQASTGNISSPGFPASDYPNNIECEWTIITTLGNHIRLSFVEQFDIETSVNCTNDFIEVMDWRMKMSENPPAFRWISVTKFCGKQLPSSVSSRREKMKLRLRTNAAVQGKGFKAQWESVCGGEFKASSGVIVSPNYPGQYPSQANCSYIINAPDDSYVTINFEVFNLEGSFSGSRCRYDWVQMTYSSSGSQVQTGKYCGRRIPPSFRARGRIVLNFITDRTVQRSGFLANYTVRACGGSITEPTIISLPTSPSNYFHNMNCRWNITAPSGKQVVFKFLSLSLEGSSTCNYDKVQLYNGLTTEPLSLIGAFCGNHSEDVPIRRSSGNTATVTFTSDSSVEREGFRLSVSFALACGRTVNISSLQQSETIQSLDTNNDGNYEPMLHCVWLILTPADHIVHLQFSRFQLEPQPENDTRICPFDYVEVFDGLLYKDERLLRRCGSEMPTAVSSSSNTMLVVFNSDSANQTSGFEATVSSRAHPCGTSSLLATNAPQALQSPQYPESYPVSLRCRWIITAVDESTPIIRFDDFRLEESEGCSKDRLIVEPVNPDGIMGVTFDRSANSGPQYMEIGGHSFSFPDMSQEIQVCGSTLPHEVQFSSKQLAVTFVSDSDTTDRGFRLHYSQERCNRTYSQPSGQINARGRNDGYPCTAVIMAPPDHYVALYFTIVVIDYLNECTPNKNLTIYDGESTASPLVSTVCGYTTPSPVFSTGRALTLMLSASDNTTWYKAHYLTSRQRFGCGGALSGALSVLSSPYAPLPSPEGLDCNYTVSVPSPYRIMMQFETIEFSGAGGCNSTFLELYDILPDDTASFVARYCGDELPALHMTQGSRAALRYVTGQQVQGPGWSVIFRSAQANPAVHGRDELTMVPGSTTATPLP